MMFYYSVVKIRGTSVESNRPLYGANEVFHA